MWGVQDGTPASTSSRRSPCSARRGSWPRSGCRRIILQNFGGTLAVDGLGIGFAAFGLLNPLFAAFIHVASDFAFILNSTRLLPTALGAPAIPEGEAGGADAAKVGEPRDA